ncbi:adenosine deaminase [soil metagenome]
MRTRIDVTDAAGQRRATLPFPKIELHVHLEGTIRSRTLLEIAGRNGIRLPATTQTEVAALYEFRDFGHFIEVWMMTTAVLRRADDFRQVVVEYAEEAASHGAVYVEAIFSPAEPAYRGVPWEDIFEGYCDGAQEARERIGVEVRLTPDIPRDYPLEAAETTARHAMAYRERGIVGLGLGGLEAEYPPEPFALVFRMGRDAGLGSAPHAGELAGPASIRGALTALGADRLRHGIRAVEDPSLIAELSERGTVLDVCPTSNVRTGAVRSLAEHPLPALVAAGVRCSLGSDDPAMFDTDLGREYAAAASMGLDPHSFYDAGVVGALCDEATRERLSAIGAAFDWSSMA